MSALFRTSARGLIALNAAAGRSLVLLRNKIRVGLPQPWSLPCVVDVCKKSSKNYCKAIAICSSKTWIAEVTSDLRLRNAMLFASTEEYCLRPVRNQPLIVHRFVNYLRRTQRGGLTAAKQWLYSASFFWGADRGQWKTAQPPRCAGDRPVWGHLLEDQQALRTEVKQEFEMYLATHLEQKQCSGWTLFSRSVPRGDRSEFKFRN